MIQVHCEFCNQTGTLLWARDARVTGEVEDLDTDGEYAQTANDEFIETGLSENSEFMCSNCFSTLTKENVLATATEQ